MAALADYQDAILAEIEASPYIIRQSKQSWIRHTFGGDEWTIFALLVLYLPNLRSITISGSDKDLYHLKRLTSNIANANTEYTQNLPTPLSKLSHIRLERQSTKSSAPLLEWLSLVAGLPSLQRLSEKCVVGHCSKRSQPLKPSSGINLTAIEFTRSDMEVGIFNYLLSRIKALQTFKYSHEDSPHNRASWEPRNIAQLLKTLAAHSRDVASHQPFRSRVRQEIQARRDVCGLSDRLSRSACSSRSVL